STSGTSSTAPGAWTWRSCAARCGSSSPATACTRATAAASIFVERPGAPPLRALRCLALMSRLLLLAGLLAALALPAGASASLVFQRGALDGSVWIAQDDGTQQRRLTDGRDPRISPDGSTVAFGNLYTQRV